MYLTKHVYELLHQYWQETHTYLVLTTDHLVKARIEDDKGAEYLWLKIEEIVNDDQMYCSIAQNTNTVRAEEGDIVSIQRSDIFEHSTIHSGKFSILGNLLDTLLRVNDENTHVGDFAVEILKEYEKQINLVAQMVTPT
jgi:uncharacterized protein YegJ (DUF2314 family)